MLASLAAGGGRGAPAGGGAGGMRELDSEAPVIWPAWCYSAESGGVGGGERARAAVARRCARDPAPAPPLHQPWPHQLPAATSVKSEQSSPHQPQVVTSAKSERPPPHQLPVAVKSERLSPSHNDNRSSVSRSRSVTPSTSSYPGTPPERDASPAAAPTPAPARNYSDIMRSLAARYNHAPQAHNDFFHPSRANGFTSALDARLGLAKVAGALLAPSSSLTPGTALGSSHGSPHASTGVPMPARTSPVCSDSDQVVGGLFAGFSTAGHGRQQRMLAFPSVIDMSSTKTLLAIAKAARSSGAHGGSRTGRERRSKRPAGGVPEHSPLDLSAGAELAKRARRSSASSTSHTSSPRPTSPKEHDERPSDTESREERSGESGGGATRGCDCAGDGYERLAAWAVDDVCEFVQSIDICSEYAPNFREQRIDGSGLPLLTEDHLTGMLQMKLGPALKLKAILRKRLASCHRCASSSPARTDRLNGGAHVKSEPNSGAHYKSEPNSHSNSPS